LGRERRAAVRPELRQQVRPEAGAADRAAQHVRRQGERLRAPVAEVHDQGLAEVAARGHDSKGTVESCAADFVRATRLHCEFLADFVRLGTRGLWWLLCMERR